MAVADRKRLRCKSRTAIMAGGHSQFENLLPVSFSTDEIRGDTQNFRHAIYPQSQANREAGDNFTPPPRRRPSFPCPRDPRHGSDRQICR